MHPEQLRLLKRRIQAEMDGSLRVPDRLGARLIRLGRALHLLAKDFHHVPPGSLLMAPGLVTELLSQNHRLLNGQQD